MICTQEFEKQITNSHLKKHNTNTVEYKDIYGENSLTCPIYKNSLSLMRQGEANPNFNKKWDSTMKEDMSKNKKGSVPWNKGKTYQSSKKMSEAIKRREQKYLDRTLIRSSTTMSDSTKEKISVALKEYAEKNKTELRDRAKKALDTKIKNGYDLGKNMRGKKHSDETKTKLAEIRVINNKNKTKESIENITANALKANCKIISFDQQSVNLICLTCNCNFNFTKQYFTDSKLRLNCCPNCFPKIPNHRSKGEEELFQFILSIEPTAKNNIRQILDKSEIDIYLPKQKIAIEYNGLYWHSEEVLENNGKSKLSDSQKRKKALEYGLRYISVFEDEWINKKEIVQSRIKNILGKTENVIFARKCKILLVKPKIASLFCEQNHIQGKGRSNERYGLYYNDELVSLMTFSKSNLSRKITGWEINRFCSKLDTNVVGGASKLFKHFLSIHKPKQVISYSDNRWSQGQLYKNLNFTFSHETQPNYWYLIPNSLVRIHRFKLRKTNNDSKNLSEMKLRSQQGYKRIWDCGSSKWLWADKNGA